MSQSDYYQHQKKIGKLAELISSRARQKMFSSFMEELKPEAGSTVLDIGVTSDRRADSNFFEKYYPYPGKITAVGLEDASFLEEDYPGLSYVRADALNLPFKDKEFDIAVSWAVIEHVGSREKQEKFLHEILRVSKRAFITTPNRWYPIEFHTVTPLLHWLPPERFRQVLKALKMDFYASEDTLNLLDESDFMRLLPTSARVRKLHHRLLGPISNLVFAVGQMSE